MRELCRKNKEKLRLVVTIQYGERAWQRNYDSAALTS